MKKKPTPINTRMMRKIGELGQHKKLQGAEPAKERDIETPVKNIDAIERKTTESTLMPNTVEQEKNTMEFSPICTQEEATHTPETIKDD